LLAGAHNSSGNVDFTARATGPYQIIAFDAPGGSCSFAVQGQNFVGAGGLGAEIGGTFNLAAGEVLQDRRLGGRSWSLVSRPATARS
jgi:hypothetical protein